MSSEERAARYSDLFDSNHEHAPECAYCPICATIAVVRRARPEVLEHLTAAARELVTVAAMLLEEAEAVIEQAQGPEDAAPERPSNVRRIDIG